jgi:hypothetical protein
LIEVRFFEVVVREMWPRIDIGTRGAQENAITRLAASEDCGPAVDRRDIGVRDNLGRDESQHTAKDDSLHAIRDDGSPEHDGENAFACISSSGG